MRIPKGSVHIRIEEVEKSTDNYLGKLKNINAHRCAIVNIILNCCLLLQLLKIRLAKIMLTVVGQSIGRENLRLLEPLSLTNDLRMNPKL